MKKKIISVVLCAAMAAGVLAGCGACLLYTSREAISCGLLAIGLASIIK